MMEEDRAALRAVDLAAVSSLLLLALALSLFRLGAKSVWLDEAASIAHVRLGATSFARVLAGRDPNMGLYYALLYPWVRVFGESEFAVRSLSAIFAAAAVPALYVVGSRLFGRVAGVAAAVLLAVNAFAVQYAQEARAYSLVLLLVTASSYFFLADLAHPSRRTRAGFVLASALAVYAHYFAVYVLAAQLLAVGLARKPCDVRRWAGSLAAIAVLCAPEAAAAARGGTGRISWIPQPTSHHLVRAVLALTGGSWTLLVAFFGAGLVAASLGAAERRFWPYGYAAAWFLVPVLGSFAASFVQPMFVRYYLIVGLPGLLLLASAGLARLPRPAAAAAVLALVVVSCLRLGHWYERRSAENWRDATAYVLERARPGDAVVLYPGFVRSAFEYYERRFRSAALRELDPELPAVAPSRIWLVARASEVRRAPAPFAQLQLGLERTRQPAPLRAFHGVTVQLYRVS